MITRYKKSIALIIGFIFISLVTDAQIVGPTNPTINVNTNYYYDDGILYAVPSWAITNGTIISSSKSGTTYSVIVQWTGGNGILDFKSKFNIIDSKFVLLGPNIYTLTGGGYYCSGQGGVSVTLSNSDSGTSYQLKRDGNSVGSSVSGNGSPITWSGVTDQGDYSVLATQGSVSQTMSGLPYVGVNPTPTIFNISGGGSFCAGGSATITLSGSETSAGATYQLKRDGTNVGSPLNGTNGSLSWSGQTTSGTYTISAINGPGCNSTMYGSASITVNSLPAAPTISNSPRFGAGTIVMNASGAPGGSTYKWYTPGNSLLASGPSYTTPVVSASTTNYLYATSTSSAGCVSASSTWASVVIEPLPVISGPNNVIMTEAVTLTTASGYSSYDWRNSLNQQVSTSQSLQTNVTDTYTVTVTKSGVNGSGASSAFVLGGQFYGLNMNYVISNTALIDNISTGEQLENLPVNSVNQSIQYFDGLGRPIQTITTQGSPLKKDLVEPHLYDELGREAVKYLPFASGTSGWFNTDFVGIDNSNYSTIYNPQFQFYQNTPQVAIDNKPYAKTIFDASPLNRIIKQGAPGTDWQPVGTADYTSTDRTVKFAYELNSASEVLLWTFQIPTEEYTTTATNAWGKVNAGTAATPIYYGANQLIKNKTKDEEGNQVLEYVDKEGKTILKRVQIGAGSPSTTDSNKDSNYASTYYIYDDFGSLVCVIPPEATKRITQTSPVSEYFDKTDAQKNDFLKQWAFRYRYDIRRRMSAKQVPGAEPVFMIYDDRDRLVLTQDGNQRALATKYWSFTKYDDFNRPILTGIKDTTVALTQAQMQTAVNNHFAKTSARWSETYVGNVAGNVHGYTNKAYPVRTGAATEVDVNKYLTVTYYDNYSFRDLWYGTYIYLNESLSETANGITYTQPTTENLRVIGQVTGTKTKVLDGISKAGGAVWLRSVNYYDDKYRIVQSFSDNVKGGIDRITNVYDFVGKLLKSRNSHQIAYDIVWSEISNLVLDKKKLYKPTSVPQGNGNNSAVSLNQLGNNQNGWVEFTVDNLGLADYYGHEFLMAGLTTNKINPITSGYVFYLISDNTLSLYANGVRPISFIGYNKGDVFRISREGTDIKFYHNYKLLYTATGAPTTAMVMDIDVNKWNSGVVNARANFGGSGITQQISKSITRKFEYDHAGRLLKTWHQVDSGPNILLALNQYNELGQLVDKKLHSTVSTGANAKQSVDYRYNIRGWLTSMNDASLANTTSTTKTNDDTGDLFGMNLAYNETTLGIGNTALFNGNISGMAWSNNLGLGTAKQNAYTYTYDPMNRILSSAFKEKTASWSAALSNYGLSEAGFTYDLNGNIKTLKRNDRRGTGLMDDLVYDYGYTGIISNKLLRVTDNGDDNAGFIDGNPDTSYDYEYDANGNLKKDLNKGIASSAITYNYLNLPETVTKGGNNIRYIYDATGRKLSQVTTFGSQQKQTDYVGEYQYENDQLQFISHEEGRIAIANNKTLVTHNGDNTTNITAATSTLTAVTVNTQTYVRASANGITQKQGMFPIGGTITVQAGEQYRIRAKGYRTNNNGNTVHLYIRTNSTDLNWPGAQLATGMVAEAYAEQIVTIPAGHTTLQAGVVWGTVAAGEQFFLNDFEIIKLTSDATISANLIANGGAETLTNFYPNANVILSTYFTGTESYLKVTSNQATGTPGFLSGSIPVMPGKKYLARLRGYRSGTNAHLYVISNTNGNLVWLSALLPLGEANENWISAEFTAPSNITSVKVGALWSVAGITETMYINEVQLLAIDEGTQTYPQTGYEYQYNLKDHLGNVRLTFTATPPPPDVYTATYEDTNSTEESAIFNPSYNTAVRYNSALYNHTAGGAKSQRLSAANANEVIGLTKSLKVIPGDTVNMEVYAKFFTPTTTNSNVAGSIFASFASAFGVSAASTGDGAALYQSLNAMNNVGALFNTGSGVDPNRPKAYINYILFDEKYVPYDFGFTQIPQNALETGGGVPHQPMQLQAVAKEPGYAYIYLSNENDKIVDVFFDDLKITHRHGPVVQSDNYYPFGLTFNSYNRENSVANQYLYNGKEKQDELGLDWLDYGARMYMPEIGRWGVVDQLTDAYVDFSSYSYVLNNPLKFVDPDGKKVLYVNGYWQDSWLGKNVIGSSRPGRGYWGDGFVRAASKFFNDGRRGNGMFIDGSSQWGGDDSGSDRYTRGYEYAKKHYDELIADMKKDETFKLVTHSEGGAFGAGIAQYLIDQGKTVETILHLSTDEADEFESPKKTTTYQLGYGGDWVTGNKEVSGSDVFGVVDKFSSAKDKFLYSHGSTKGADVFKDVKALLKAASSGATGVNVTETSSGVKFEFIRKNENEEKQE